jgi:hypothetical protein
MEGQGNITYNSPGGATSGAITAANNGLTDIAGVVQLGQVAGLLTNDAKLLHDTEIPDNGHYLSLGKNDALSDIILFKPSIGIGITNAVGLWLSMQSGVGGGGSGNLTISSDDLLEVLMSFNASSGNLIFNSSGTGNREDFTFDRPVIASGGGSPATNINNASSPYAVLDTDAIVLIDSSAGAVTVNMNRALLKNHLIRFKKTSADVNNITLVPSAGTIQELGPSAATFVFQNQGESYTVYCDGTNFFIV